MYLVTPISRASGETSSLPMSLYMPYLFGSKLIISAPALTRAPGFSGINNNNSNNNNNNNNNIFNFAPKGTAPTHGVEEDTYIQV